MDLERFFAANVGIECCLACVAGAIGEGEGEQGRR